MVPDFTLTANFKMAAKENTFQAPMKSVIFIQLLTFCRNSLCYFHFYPTFEIEAAWMSNDKKALDVGVFEPFDQEYGASQVHLVKRL